MRRFRQTTRFGAVSTRERRNADLFFAELTGRSGPRASRSRQGADSFMEALMGWDPPRLAESIAEAYAEAPDAAPTVKEGADKDEIFVTRADGTRFVVRRKVRAKVFTKSGGPPRVGVCSDDERVFFRLKWCEGTQGKIDIGANAQGAIKALLEKAAEQINRGEDPEKIKQTFESATVQAFLEFDITKRDKWTITGDIKLDINRTGVTAGSARLSADRGWLKLGVEVKVGADGQQVLVTVDIPLEKRKIKGKECTVRELVVWWEIECLKEIPITITIKPPVPFIEKREKLFLYFDYAKDTLRQDPKPKPGASTDEIGEILKSEPKIGTARLNKRALEKLDHFVGQGYWLISVDGFASPEGRRGGPGTRERGTLAAKWEGNDALAIERAQKARTLIEQRYVLPTLKMRDIPPRMIFPSGEQMPQGVGRSERPKLNDALGKELEGAALDRALINGDTKLGVKPFLEENDDELKSMTDDDQKFVLDKSKSVRDRAERLFENLRRVEINLKQRQMLKDAKVPSTVLEHLRTCPKDLMDAAEKQWGPVSRLTFQRRDPPICKD
jgi:hypothetical protein